MLLEEPQGMREHLQGKDLLSIGGLDFQTLMQVLRNEDEVLNAVEGFNDTVVRVVLLLF